jgi:methionine synthase II (cobalamin-independent)
LLNKRRKKPHSRKISDELGKVCDILRKTNVNDYNRHIHNKVATKDHKKLWQNLNSILGRTKENIAPTLVTTNGQKVEKPAEVSNEFNKFFSSCA